MCSQSKKSVIYVAPPRPIIRNPIFIHTTTHVAPHPPTHLRIKLAMLHVEGVRDAVAPPEQPHCWVALCTCYLGATAFYLGHIALIQLAKHGARLSSSSGACAGTIAILILNQSSLPLLLATKRYRVDGMRWVKVRQGPLLPGFAV